MQGQALQPSAGRSLSCFLQVVKDSGPQKMNKFGNIWPTLLSQYPMLLFPVIHIGCGHISRCLVVQCLLSF